MRNEESMGANSTQAQGVAVFLIGFTMFAAGVAKGYSIWLIGVGAILICVAIALFRKCKPWEQEDR